MSDEKPDGIRSADCPLSWPEQRRNLVLFAFCTGMQYLSAPLQYVGTTQAPLCNLLGADARTANLPGTLFFAMTAVPAIIAWLSPRVDSLRRNIALCYAASAVSLAATAIALLSSAPHSLKFAAVILQAGVTGATIPTAIALLWEVIGRGSSESRRGLALSLAFGVGPILAVLGSFGQAALLGGEVFGLKLPGIDYPWNFVVLYAAAAPVMGLAAIASQFFIVPPVRQEPRREPAAAVAGLLAGVPCMFASVALMHLATVTENELWRYVGYAMAAFATGALVHHFRPLLRRRVLLLATVVTILVYAGNMIPSNMNLYSKEVLGNSPEQYAGVQNMLRFGCKVVAGLALGWLLMRTNARAGMLATSAIFLASQVWAMLATGPWYLLASGIFGAGELIGVYSPNYIVSASRQDELRRNTAFATLLMVPAAAAGYLYGAIVDFARDNELTALGLTPDALGFRASFFVCALLILSGIVVAVCWLPRQPRPAE